MHNDTPWASVASPKGNSNGMATFWYPPSPTTEVSCVPVAAMDTHGSVEVSIV